MARSWDYQCQCHRPVRTNGHSTPGVHSAILSFSLSIIWSLRIPLLTTMCGIAGIFNSYPSLAPQEIAMRRMLGMIRHRGPDEFGIYLGEHVALGNARLSIVDLSGGQQPIGNEDGS